jgi:hypothetical protein
MDAILIKCQQDAGLDSAFPGAASTRIVPIFTTDLLRALIRALTPRPVVSELWLLARGQRLV